MKLLLTWVLHAFALMSVAYVLPGVQVDGFMPALWAALVLGLINTLIKPLFILLTLPITVLTLGLFYFLLNGLMFYWAGALVDGFRVEGLLWATAASLLYSVIAWFLNAAFLAPPVRIERL